MYKKEFLDSYNDFYFDTGLIFEDVPFQAKSLLRAKKYHTHQNTSTIIDKIQTL